MASPSSEATFSTAPNEQLASLGGANAASDSTPAEESGTFEMGYITFFPKNNNETFQSIPEPPAPEELEQLKPSKVNTTTNAWTAEQSNQAS